jgi:protein-disulfide isomerase
MPRQNGEPSRVDSIVNVGLLVCAVVAVIALLKRESRPSESNASAAPGQVATRLAVGDWRNVMQAAQIDSATESVSVVEFVDVECPFCRTFAATLDSVSSSRPLRIQVGIAHLPLRQHRFAQIGARAVECARPEGRANEFLNVLYDSQATIGLTPWTDFARLAGVRDSSRFVKCLALTDSLAVVQAGVATANRIGITGTPGVVVQGWLFSRPPSRRLLEALVDSLLAGRSAEVVLKSHGVSINPH